MNILGTLHPFHKYVDVSVALGGSVELDDVCVLDVSHHFNFRQDIVTACVVIAHLLRRERERERKRERERE